MSSLLEELLPRIHNDITLAHIVTKLSWMQFHILSSVSRSWKQAIQSRQIYNRRVLSHSTETLVLIHHHLSVDIDGISIYSPREKCLHTLPPIPHVASGIREFSGCISSDGKIYVLGGRAKLDKGRSGKVYVLDLAGQRQWKRCTSMLDKRYFSFTEGLTASVINGKMYAFGGSFVDGRCEVYDPRKNSWSPLRLPLGFERPSYRVRTLGDKLFMQGASTRGLFGTRWQVYDQVTDEWKEVIPFKVSPSWESMGKLFVVEGAFYWMTFDDIEVYDFDTNSWRYQHSNLWNELGPDVTLRFVLPLDKELLAMVDCYNSTAKTLDLFLFHSTGFGSQRQDIVWQKTPGSLPCYGFSKSMCTIQL